MERHAALNEERRMPPGGFALAKHLFYPSVSTIASLSLADPKFEPARNIETYLTAKSEDLKSSPNDKVYPFLNNVRNTFCYTAPTDSSKGNTGFAHFNIELIEEFDRQY